MFLIKSLKTGYFIIMNESIHLEEIAIIEMHVPNRTLKYMKQKTYTVKGKNGQFNSNNWRFQ